MDSQFWINAWNEGRTAFHQKDYHEKLLQYFPQFSPQQGQKVLVPLCGKTKDLLWLEAQGLVVQGVELYEGAVQAFFSENNLPSPQVEVSKDFKTYRSGNISISCGDFFKLKAVEGFDFIYDRASLVALPLQMREAYAQVIKQTLKPGGKYLLIVYEYDQSKLEGPPFSVDEKEVHKLFEAAFRINLLESQLPKREGSRLSAMEEIRQKVYILEKK